MSLIYTAPANEVILISTEANALADDDLCNGTVVLDNTTNRFLYGIAELDFGAAVDMSDGNTNPCCYLYLIPSYDDTNYADEGDITSELVPGTYLKGVFAFNKIATSRRAVIESVRLAPIKYTATLFNDLGVAFPATGVTLKAKTYTSTSSD